MKQTIQNWLTRSRLTSSTYASSRALYHRSRKLLFFISDARQTFRDMRWDGATDSRYWSKSSELLFQYHKLEKGLCMPGERRFFGYDPANATLRLLKVWRALGFATNDTVYGGAIETLYAYRQRLRELPKGQTAQLEVKLSTELDLHPQRWPTLTTPQNIGGFAPDNLFETLQLLARARRSVRSFLPAPVDIDSICRAVQIAQLSPSACNRQPWQVHCYHAKPAIESLLALQNGNRGFGHTIPTLLILTCEATSFFDASERNQPYVDGGLFAMSLILALQSQGVSSCCLNWCVEPQNDALAHGLGDIPQSERIIMFIAVGYAVKTALVPQSPRRELKSIFHFHTP